MEKIIPVSRVKKRSENLLVQRFIKWFTNLDKKNSTPDLSVKTPLNPGIPLTDITFFSDFVHSSIS
jgi:hypothetical protein